VDELTTTTTDEARPTLIRWSAVFAGAVIGAALLGLLTALWIALGYGSDVSFFVDELPWFVGGSAIVAMFVAGLVAGGLSGERHSTSGLWHGLTVWGLTMVVLVSISVPAVTGGFGFANPTSAASTAASSPAAYTGTTLWAFFWAVLIGLGAAAIGGVVGGGAAGLAESLETRRSERVVRHRRAPLPTH